MDAEARDSSFKCHRQAESGATASEDSHIHIEHYWSVSDGPVRPVNRSSNSSPRLAVTAGWALQYFGSNNLAPAMAINIIFRHRGTIVRPRHDAFIFFPT
jgi:diadenosine tetraphosphatase ApaH/serine/threonine PP2A family protein phosphatase